MNVFCFCNHITPSLQDRESVCRLLEHDIRPFKPLKSCHLMRTVHIFMTFNTVAVWIEFVGLQWNVTLSRWNDTKLCLSEPFTRNVDHDMVRFALTLPFHWMLNPTMCRCNSRHQVIDTTSGEPFSTTNEHLKSRFFLTWTLTWKCGYFNS